MKAFGEWSLLLDARTCVLSAVGGGIAVSGIGAICSDRQQGARLHASSKAKRSDLKVLNTFLRHHTLTSTCKVKRGDGEISGFESSLWVNDKPAKRACHGKCCCYCEGCGPSDTLSDPRCQRSGERTADLSAHVYQGGEDS